MGRQGLLSEEQIAGAKGVDILSLVQGHTELRRESVGEWSGPCPKCGGQKRLHVNRAGWFFCRHCHPERGDAIEWVRFMQGAGFAEAVRALTGEGVAPPVVQAQHRPPQQQAVQKQQDPDWLPKASALVEAAERRLWGEDSTGLDYLLHRGLRGYTLKQFRVGYRADAPIPYTEGPERAPAIVLPWLVRGRLVAVRYRFISPFVEPKLGAKGGSDFAGRLFGGQARVEGDTSGRTLIICEGEINAMSIWQESVEAGHPVDVLSMGSESARLSAKAIEAIQGYRLVLLWADRAEVARRLRATVPGAYALRSPGGRDANDLLRQGLLWPFVVAMMADAQAKAATG